MFFLPTRWILLKQLLFLSPSWPLSLWPIRPLASWAIDPEPILLNIQQDIRDEFNNSVIEFKSNNQCDHYFVLYNVNFNW